MATLIWKVLLELLIDTNGTLPIDWIMHRNIIMNVFSRKKGHLVLLLPKCKFVYMARQVAV